MIVFGLLALGALSGVLTDFPPFDPLSDEYIDHINSIQTTWKAGRNFAKDTPMSHIKQLAGVLIDDDEEVLERVHPGPLADGEVLPEQFDSREVWPQCASIGMVRDQSKCGSCWAVSAAAAMSDRICISSNGTDQTLVSDQDILECCVNCGVKCAGGLPYEAWVYWRDMGVVSGGLYSSTTGCKAYAMEPCVHIGTSEELPECESLDVEVLPKCVATCDEGSSLDYNNSKSYGSKVYMALQTEELIQTEIYKNGPVQARFSMYVDFVYYKSGVYQRTSPDKDNVGDHAVKLIGWGVENEVPYWIAVNSWNEGWGDNGMFKIIRGRNECGIEYRVAAGLPRL